MKEFEKPICEPIMLTATDVITASGLDQGEMGGNQCGLN